MSFVEDLIAEADRAIADMRRAATTARALHARAELMRHMQTTARKLAGLPLDDAVAKVAGEWMQAWQLDTRAYPELAAEVTAFTRAFCRQAQSPTDEGEAELRRAADLLDAGFARIGTSIADQMAWRSECAHGWWAAVAPVPPDLAGARPRPGVPPVTPDQPFWTAGCAPHCRG